VSPKYAGILLPGNVLSVANALAQRLPKDELSKPEGEASRAGVVEVLTALIRAWLEE
jgi:hypothetical protein